jgi:hypothetical protein
MAWGAAGGMLGTSGTVAFLLASHTTCPTLNHRWLLGEAPRYGTAHGSNWIERTYKPCVTTVFSTTCGSAHRPSTAGNG